MDTFFIDDRRKTPRINLGRINYEAAAIVLGSPGRWEHLSFAQRVAYASAATAVITAYTASKTVEALKVELKREAVVFPTLTDIVDKYES